MQRPGNTQNQPQASKPRPGPAVRPDPDRHGMRGRGGGTVCLCVTWQSSTRPHHFRPAPGHSDTWHHQRGFSLQRIRPTYCLLPLLFLTKMNISYFSSDFVESTTICQALAPDNRLPYYLFKQFSLFADSCECSQLRL